MKLIVNRMHLPPIVWGPFFWHTMHIVALGYAKHPTYTDKKCAKEFYESLTFLIPCSVCREHYKEHFVNNPITPFLDSKEDLLKWTIDIHNKVNKFTPASLLRAALSSKLKIRVGLTLAKTAALRIHLNRDDPTYHV
jgi:hypothetical protein